MKIHNILDKSMKRAQSEVFQDEYLFGQVEVNFAEMTASRAGHPVVLTTMEFRVLKYLIRHERQVITRDALLTEVWGYTSYPTTRTVDNHIFRLRQKLERDPSNPIHLRTVCGAGYKFISEAPAIST
jgi:DNA-binding response OmpR family regulator